MKLLSPIFLFSFSHADAIDSDALDGIYTEAIFFVLLFGIMSIISVIISKKNAKKYELANPLEERRAAKREKELKKELEDKVLKKSEVKVDKLLELSKMLQDGMINEEEFKKLKQSLNI